jgi:L-lactate dehydrogenase complex protein LldE
MPRVGLFIPCYVDQLYPRVGLATVSLLEKVGCTVEFPSQQTCCGQPMANTGCTEETRPLAERFLAIFGEFDYVVAPGFDELKRKTFELCEFLTDVMHVNRLDVHFPYKVGLHQSCHGLRELRLASSSELVGAAYGKARQLLELVEGVQIAELKRPDECCGFGGTFAVAEEAVSCMMGNDRIHDHEQAGVEVMTANDMSCLMHLHGLIRRQGKPIRAVHIVEILSGQAEGAVVPAGDVRLGVSA